MAEDCVFDDILFGFEDVFELDDVAIEKASRKILGESFIENAFDNLGRKTETFEKTETRDVEITINVDQGDFMEGMDLIVV